RRAALVAKARKRNERKQGRRQVAISGGHREGPWQLRRDESRHQEHQAVDAQASVEEKRRQRSLRRAISDARPGIPIRNEAEDDKRDSVADQIVDQGSLIMARAALLEVNVNPSFDCKQCSPWGSTLHRSGPQTLGAFLISRTSSPIMVVLPF